VPGWWDDLLSWGSRELESLYLLPPRRVEVFYARIGVGIRRWFYGFVFGVGFLYFTVLYPSRYACQKVWGYFPGHLKLSCISLKNLYLADYKWVLLKKQQLGFFFESAAFSIA
jgi:hypothetical protein